MGAIAPSEVAAWLDLRGIGDPGLRRDYAEVVRIVDHAFLANRKDWTGEAEEEEEEERKAEEKKAQAKLRRGRRDRR